MGSKSKSCIIQRSLPDNPVWLKQVLERFVECSRCFVRWLTRRVQAVIHLTINRLHYDNWGGAMLLYESVSQLVVWRFQRPLFLTPRGSSRTCLPDLVRSQRGCSRLETSESPGCASLGGGGVDVTDEGSAVAAELVACDWWICSYGEVMWRVE